MNEPFYPFTTLQPAFRYTFESLGKRVYQKVVLFTSTSEPNLFQLSLADKLSDGSLDFLSISNNGDLQKIMATLVQIILTFFNDKPDAMIAFTGSTPQRTRLYRIVLARELEKINNRFVIKGLTDEGFETFKPNREYIGFVIFNKNIQQHD